MPNDVTIVYNLYNDPDVPPAKLAELRRAVKWLRAADSFSMGRWVAEMSADEMRQIAQDILQAAGKIGERLKDRHQSWDERLLGQRLRAAESFEDLEYEDLLSVLATRETWMHIRHEHHAATIKWMTPRVQKEVEAHWQAVAAQQARAPTAAEVTKEVYAMLPKVADDNAATAD